MDINKKQVVIIVLSKSQDIKKSSSDIKNLIFKKHHEKIEKFKQLETNIKEIIEFKSKNGVKIETDSYDLDNDLLTFLKQEDILGEEKYDIFSETEKEKSNIILFKIDKHLSHRIIINDLIHLNNIDEKYIKDIYKIKDIKNKSKNVNKREVRLLVSNELRNILIDEKQKKVKISIYEIYLDDYIYIKRCINCFDYDHTKCDKQLCKICCKPKHKSFISCNLICKFCENENNKEYNHSVFSKNCPKYKEKEKILREKIYKKCNS